MSKKNKIVKNKTKKNKINLILSTITEKDKSKICGNSIPFTSFEKKYARKFVTNLARADAHFERKIVKQLRESSGHNTTNLSVKPYNDYYTYINQKWLKETHTKKNQGYIIEVDDFRIVQDKVYYELLKIVEDYIKDNKNELSKCLSNYYESLKRLNTNEESSFYATIMLNHIDHLRKNKDNLWEMLAFTNKNEMISFGSPFTWSLNPDDKEPTIFRCYVDGPQLSLIDTSVYINDGTNLAYINRYKNAYYDYLRELFENAFGKHHSFNVKDVYEVELKMLNAMICNFSDDDDLGTAESNYNKITHEEALNKYHFNWKEFAKFLGFEKIPSFFITSNVNYLKCGTELLLKEWDSEQWRTYWVYLHIRQQQRYNHRGKMLHYNFFGKFVTGQQAPVDIKLYPVYGLGYAFNTFLTNHYIDQYADQRKIDYLKVLAEDLVQVFIRIIKENTWLQPETKASALKKLYHFNFTVGSPKLLRADPLLNYSSIDCWGNLMKISHWRHRKAVKLEGDPVIDIPVIDWAQNPPKFIGTQAYVVNAAYTPAKNGIYIPNGYIQEPFIDLDERGIEYNLAYIGFTLGHEMSHSLDDWGSQYDYTGKLHDWWTAKDKKIFKKIQDDVIKQYETFASYDGIKFDASPGIGEDLADISGLNICVEYLRDFQLKNKDVLPIRALSFEAFFTYFAWQWRQQINKKAIAAQLKTNPHPLDKYRTNVPLSRIPLFRAIFDIKKKNKMYWHSTSRVWQGEYED
jgi:predicted metalloendopeptidase